MSATLPREIRHAPTPSSPVHRSRCRCSWESAVHGYADAIVALVTHLGRCTSRPMAIDDPQAGHSREAPTSPAVHI